MVALLRFGLYPQAFYPQLSIIAACALAAPYNGESAGMGSIAGEAAGKKNAQDENGLLEFCRTPRTRSEIIEREPVSRLSQGCVRKRIPPLVMLYCTVRRYASLIREQRKHQVPLDVLLCPQAHI